MTVYHTHLQALDGSWRVRNGNTELEGGPVQVPPAVPGERVDAAADCGDTPSRERIDASMSAT